MARPTDSAEWASDAGRRLEPAAGEKDSGFNEGTRTPARKANWIVGVVADWATYLSELFDADDEHSYLAEPTRTVLVQPAALTLLSDSAGDHGFLHDTSQRPNGWPILRSTGAANNRAFLALNRYLPSNAIIDRVRLFFQYNDDTGHEVEMLLLTQLFTNTGGGTDIAFGADAEESIAIYDGFSGGGTFTLDSGTGLSFNVREPDDAATLLELRIEGEGHHIYAIEFTITDRGLTNR